MINHLLNKNNYRYFTLFWGLFIIILSSIPHLPQPDTNNTGGVSLRFDYLFHFLVYFILGMLVVIWQTDHQASLSSKTYFIAIITGVLFGFMDEWHQLLIPGRTFNPIDSHLNTIGYIIGFLFTYHYLIQHLTLTLGKFSRCRAMLYPNLKDQPLSPEK